MSLKQPQIPISDSVPPQTFTMKLRNKENTSQNSCTSGLIRPRIRYPRRAQTRKAIAGIEDDLEVRPSTILTAGQGLFTLREFHCAEPVVAYHGEILTYEEAEARELEYAAEEKGNYILYYKCNGKSLAIDATNTPEHKARYINHSSDPQVINIRPHLTWKEMQGYIIFYASRTIPAESELFYDYAETDTNALAKFEWLKPLP
jgi:hypothetical protein